jgi:hypothetical protein
MAENLEFESPQAKRVWESSLAKLRENQERLKRIGIVSLMRVEKEKVLMSMSMTSIARAIGKQIQLSQGHFEIEVREKAIVVTITK